MTDETNGALRSLKEFMKAMTKWETECEKLDKKVEAGTLDDEKLEEMQMKKLRELQSKHCADLKRVRRSFTCQWPPEYDPKSTEINVVTPKGAGKVLIELQQKEGLETRMRIELVAVDGKWKVSRRWMLFKNGDAVATPL